jgi:alpha/beta hydrolase fold
MPIHSSQSLKLLEALFWAAWSSHSLELSIFFASELRAVVFSVQYRLAPEHDLRTIVNDCYEAVNWTMSPASCTTYRTDAARLGLWGCSAGAHLAATVALRDATEHNPARFCVMSLVVPAVCHPDALPSLLKQVLEKKKQTYPEEPFNFLGLLEKLYGECLH